MEATSARNRGSLRRGRATALAFLCALALFASGASLRDLWRTDEHRYAEVARQMAAGVSWVVPHVNGDVYEDKPPGFFWMAALAHRGGLGLAHAAMAPSVLAGAACVALAFALAWSLYGVPHAVATACVLASSELFLSLALRANLDALLTFTTTAAVAAYAALELGRPSRAGTCALAAGGVLALAGGVLVKGFVALLVPAAAVLGHRLLARRTGLRLGLPALVGALVLALALACAWLGAAAWEAGREYARDLVVGHGIGHALGSYDKVRPPWYYLESFPAGFVPWVVLLPAALVRAARRPLASRDALVLAWLGVPLLLLSLFPAKRHLYVAPLHPAAALLVGSLLGARLRGAFATGAVERVLWQGGRIALGVAAVGCGALLLAAALLPEGALAWGRPWTALLAASTLPRWLAPWLGGALLLSGAIVLLGRSVRIRARAACALGPLVAASLALIFHPVEAAGRDDRAFYAEVARRIGEEPLVSYGGFDFAPNWLLRRDRVPNLRTPARMRDYLARARGRVWVLEEAQKLPRLGLPPGGRVVLRGTRPLDDGVLLIERPAPGEGAPEAAPEPFPALGSGWAGR